MIKCGKIATFFLFIIFEYCQKYQYENKKNKGDLSKH